MNNTATTTTTTIKAKGSLMPRPRRKRVHIDELVSRRWVVARVIRQLKEIQRQSGKCFIRWFEDTEQSTDDRALGYFLITSRDVKAMNVACSLVEREIVRHMDERRSYLEKMREERRLERQERAIIAREQRDRRERDRRRPSHFNRAFNRKAAEPEAEKKQQVPNFADFPSLPKGQPHMSPFGPVVKTGLEPIEHEGEKPTFSFGHTEPEDKKEEPKGKADDAWGEDA